MCLFTEYSQEKNRQDGRGKTIFTYLKNIIRRVKSFLARLAPSAKEPILVPDTDMLDMPETSAILLEGKDFAIVFRESRVEAVVPTHFDDPDFLASEEGEEHLDYVDNTVSYIMHALLREDWREEYYHAVEEYVKTLPSPSEIEALRRRSEFKLITSSDDDTKEE